MAAKSKHIPSTEALRTYYENILSLLDTLMLQVRELNRLIKEAEQLPPPTDADFQTMAEAESKELTRSLGHQQAARDRRMAGIEAVGLWQVVMLVTCVEAYLQDVLASAASVDPDLMSKPEAQAIPYADVLQAASLEGLASNVRAQWARRWVDNAGPTRWLERLVNLGVRGYPNDLALRLERIWGIRHLVVHRAGVANADFARLHPGVVQAIGDRVRVSSEDLGAFIDAARVFVRRTDEYFLKRYPSLLAAPREPPAAASDPTPSGPATED